jgi:hypothetical protein
MNKIKHCIGLLNAAVTNGEDLTQELVTARQEAYEELDELIRLASKGLKLENIEKTGGDF